MTIVAVGIVLGVLIFIHELGHFLACKISGVRVERFSLGFGPRLLGFTDGETDYRISAVPFGGYVKMEGEDPEEMKEREAAGQPISERSFLAKSRGVRAFIVGAGPFMNFMLAVVVLTFVAAYQGEPITLTREIGEVIEGTPAALAGLAEGDTVVAVDGERVGTWDDVVISLVGKLGRTTDITVERDGTARTLSLDLAEADSISHVGVLPFRLAIVGDVKYGGPAHAAGLRSGDRIVRIDDREITTWTEMREAIMASPNREVHIEWVRDGQRHASTVTPQEAKGGVGQIEVVVAVDTRQTTIGQSVRTGFYMSAFFAKQLFLMPRELLRGVPARELVGGPVRIGELAGEAFRWGLWTFLVFIAAINAQLCMVNLLPIPPLDGGHLIVLGAESVTRKSMDLKQRMMVQQIGFVVLVGVMILITFWDVSRFITG